jgi:hypothetical protein
MAISTRRLSGARFRRRCGVGLAVGALIATTAVHSLPASADTAPVSQSRGRFLSGVIGGTDLDTIAAIAGETAQNYGGATVTHANSLNASALNGAVNLPLTGVLQLPGANTVQLGAVNQIAQAASDGSAMGASGAVSNSGGISVGGSTGAPADATIDLAGLGGSGLAQTLGDLTLSLGAVAARADQASVDGAQTGTYHLAGLSIDLTSPALAQLTGPLVTQLTSALRGLAAQLNSTPLGVITVTGLDTFPSASSALTSVQLGNGAVTASLTSGAIHIDVAALLASLGLDLNHLPANTHLMPYLSKALSSLLPTALSSMLSSLQSKYLAAFGNLGFSIAGVPLNASQLATLMPVLDSGRTALTNALTQAAGQASTSVFTPLASAFSSMFDVLVNGQSTTGGTFTEQAVQVNLGSGAAGAQVVLASASVGPGTPAQAVDAPLPSPTQTVAAGRSPIKIDAGRPGTGNRPDPWLAGAAVLLIAAAAAGLLSMRRPSAVRLAARASQGSARWGANSRG